MPYSPIGPGCTGLTYYGQPGLIISYIRGFWIVGPPPLILAVPNRPLHELVPSGLGVILAPVATLAPP